MCMLWGPSWHWTVVNRVYVNCPGIVSDLTCLSLTGSQSLERQRLRPQRKTWVVPQVALHCQTACDILERGYVWVCPFTGLLRNAIVVRGFLGTLPVIQCPQEKHRAEQRAGMTYL